MSNKSCVVFTWKSFRCDSGVPSSTPLLEINAFTPKLSPVNVFGKHQAMFCTSQTNNNLCKLVKTTSELFWKRRETHLRGFHDVCKLHAKCKEKHFFQWHYSIACMQNHFWCVNIHVKACFNTYHVLSEVCPLYDSFNEERFLKHSSYIIFIWRHWNASYPDLDTFNISSLIMEKWSERITRSGCGERDGPAPLHHWCPLNYWCHLLTLTCHTSAPEHFRLSI